MNDYIEREAALSAQNKSMNLAECRKRLERIPAADARPVRRGRWEYNPGDNIPYCSGCMMPQDSECNFCPNCGADMRAEPPKEE